MEPAHPGFLEHWRQLPIGTRWRLGRIAFAGQRADDPWTAWLVVNYVRREMSRFGTYAALALGMVAAGIVLLFLGVFGTPFIAGGVGSGLGLLIRRTRYPQAEHANEVLAAQDLDAPPPPPLG